MSDPDTTGSPSSHGRPDYARGYEHFPGHIGRTAAESTRAWPRERRAPEGAPNVIVVLLDDMGYSDIGPFGSEIATPTLDQIAAEGVRLTNYHTTPVCSPARAALLTGLNPHRAGYGSVANSDPGFPGLRLELDPDVETIPEILRSHGYATFGIGKWHLTRDAQINAAADKSSWPIQRGFDHYYGTLEGLNSFFHPNQIIRDNTPVEFEETPENYYLTDDYTDEAIKLIKGLRASDSRKPFFLYFAHTAMHGPLGAKPEDLAKYRGAYDEGWDVLRERRHARQIELGVIPAGTPLPPRNFESGLAVPAWDSLDAEQQSLYARYMEVYAAMVDSVDQSLARILATLEALGERENTIVVFTSDNGGTAEGGEQGTRSYFSRFVHIPGLPEDWEPDVNREPELIGGPQSMVHYPRGWGMASNTPFRLYKGQTFAGGIRVPLLLSWPAGLPHAEGDAGVRTQYQYVTDVLPTLLDLIGVESRGLRHNLPTKPIDGFSFSPVVHRAEHPSTHPEQYSEFGGNRGFYKEGWKIVTLHPPGTPYDDNEWQLYHVETDPNELVNLAESEPGKVKELALAWERAAWENTVFPLPSVGILDAVRRPAEDELARGVTLLPGTPRLERHRSAALTTLRAFEVTIRLRVAEGDRGVLVAHGDQGGGYAVHIEDGRLVGSYNAYGELHELDAGPIAPGAHVISVVSTPSEGFRCDFRLLVDGAEVGALTNQWLLLGMAPFSGIDVGVNRGGPVNWGVYERHGSFRFTGDLHSVRYQPGPQADYDPALVAAVLRDAAEFFD
mgnify:CR=1 FL=1